MTSLSLSPSPFSVLFLPSSFFVFYSTLSLIKGRLHSPTINIIYKSTNFSSYLNLRSMQDIGSMHLECNCELNKDVLSTNPGKETRTTCSTRQVRRSIDRSMDGWSTHQTVQIALRTKWTREGVLARWRFGGHFHF